MSNVIGTCPCDTVVYVHRTVCDGEIRPSAEELDGGRFWTMQEIRDAMGKGIFTPNFESEFKRCFAKELDIKYAIFFDVDGTLVSFKTHEILPSTIFALTQAKANGHKVFIATGRPPLPNSRLMVMTNFSFLFIVVGFIFGLSCFSAANIAIKDVKPRSLPKVLTNVE